MGLELDSIVPWGRSFAEYVSMFELTEEDLGLRILGCGDGPAAFNATLTRRGGSVVSVDPIYAFDTAQIRDRIAATYASVMEQMAKNRDDYLWRQIPSVEALGEIRLSAMADFLADYAAGKLEGRYVTGELPSLPFNDGQFDLALSSHFLFLYNRHLSLAFHTEAILEMLRVAREVRIFPLLVLDGTPSPHLGAITECLATKGFSATVSRVPYEFQKGGNEMLVVKRA